MKTSLLFDLMTLARSCLSCCALFESLLDAGLWLRRAITNRTTYPKVQHRLHNCIQNVCGGVSVFTHIDCVILTNHNLLKPCMTPSWAERCEGQDEDEKYLLVYKAQGDLTVAVFQSEGYYFW